MASSIVHLAIINELSKRLPFRDTARLKFGAVVVDAGYDGNSHLKISLADGRTTYDFERFRRLFGERMLTDDLYLGYYLHLVQDALYRRFVYGKHRWDPTIPGNIERLHRDYSLVNPHVITKYGLRNDLAVPDGFAREELCQLCAFDTETLLKDMESYFLPVEEAPIFFFTAELSDAFIAEAVELCAQEVEDLRSGKRGLDMTAYAWDRREKKRPREG